MTNPGIYAGVPDPLPKMGFNPPPFFLSLMDFFMSFLLDQIEVPTFNKELSIEKYFDQIIWFSNSYGQFQHYEIVLK